MKFLKISPNKKMVQLGENTKTASWYNLGDITLGDLKEGDDVEFLSVKKNGANYINSIGKVGSTPKTEVKEKPKEAVAEKTNKEETKIETKVESKVEPKVENKPDVKKEVIKKVSVEKTDLDLKQPLAWDVEERMNIGKIVSETLIAIEGVTEKNVYLLIDNLFKKYSEHIYK